MEISEVHFKKSLSTVASLQSGVDLKPLPVHTFLVY